MLQFIYGPQPPGELFTRSRIWTPQVRMWARLHANEGIQSSSRELRGGGIMACRTTLMSSEQINGPGEAGHKRSHAGWGTRGDGIKRSRREWQAGQMCRMLQKQNFSIKRLHRDAGFILFVCREGFFVHELSETAKLETETWINSIFGAL